MFLKVRKNRSYQYTPRFYDPAKERREGNERRPIRFRRGKGRTSSLRSMIFGFAVIALIIYALHQLAQLAK